MEIETLSSASLDSSSSEPPSGPPPEPTTPTTPAPSPNPPTPADPNAKVYLLYVAKAGMGTVMSSPAGINCGADCSESFATDTSVTLTAAAASGSSFKGWSGACTGTSLTCTLRMSAIRNVNVNFESNTSEGSIDALIATMPSNSWKSLPNTLMKDACPAPYSAYFCEGVISAWSGGAYDEKLDRMVIIGGGHADSWYNNVFAFDLGSMQWLRLNEMPPNSGTKPPDSWNDIRIEPCGFYPKGPLTIPADFMRPNSNYVDISKCSMEPLVSQLDFQQPRSTHSYQRVFVDPAQGRYCYILLGTYPSAQTSTNVVVCLDPATGLWERIADRPENVAGRGQTAVDSAGHVWSITDGGGPIGEYNPITNSWATYGYVNFEAGGTTDIDRKRNHLYVLYPLSPEGYSLRKFDLNSAASLNKRPAWTETSVSGDRPTTLGQRPGFVYVDAKDQFYAWGGGRDVYTLDPTTGVWKKTTAGGDDPGVQANWGTYGRFRYSPKRGVFVVVNSTTRNVFIYKP